jgi:hypothetical protein
MGAQDFQLRETYHRTIRKNTKHNDAAGSNAKSFAQKCYYNTFIFSKKGIGFDDIPEK